MWSNNLPFFFTFQFCRFLCFELVRADEQCINVFKGLWVLNHDVKPIRSKTQRLITHERAAVRECARALLYNSRGSGISCSQVHRGESFSSLTQHGHAHLMMVNRFSSVNLYCPTGQMLLHQHSSNRLTGQACFAHAFTHQWPFQTIMQKARALM